MKLQAMVLAVAALALAGCGSPVTMTQASPTAPISSAGTYSYTLTFVSIQESPMGCEYINTCVINPLDCSHDILQLHSDTGAMDLLNNSSGSIYLGTGNWTGVSGTGDVATSDGCIWTLTLTSP